MVDSTGHPVRFKYTATAEDLTLAYQRYNRQLPKRGRTALSLFVALALAGIALYFTMPKQLEAAALIVLTAAAGGIIGPLAMIRWRVPPLARRIYARQRDLHAAITVDG